VKPFGEAAEFVNRRVRENVHRPARTIEDEVDKAARLRLDAKLG
jgi:hypothetical protein